MAAFTVSFDGTRLNDAEALTGYTAEGATPTLEPDFRYQGGNCISALVKTTEVGFYYTSTSVNMTTRVAVLKVIQTNKDALDGNGLQVRIGSSTANYHSYYLFSASSYPSRGGFQVVVIDPNVPRWRSATTGAPSLSAVTYWGIRADCNATAKAPNLGMDALDVVPAGKGLTGVGGDGASADGTFLDFVSFDEGTTTNRYGIVSTSDGILYVNGVLTIGGATETDFTDSNRVLVFPHQRVTTGACGLDLNISHPSSVIALTNCVFNGRGSLYGSDDTRPDYDVIGSSGSVLLDGCTFNGYRQVTLNAACQARDCVFVGGLILYADGADIRGSSVLTPTCESDGSALRWDVAVDTDGYLDDTTFSRGANAHHAIHLGTSSPTSVTLRRITFEGFSSLNGQDDSAIYVARTSGNVTINAVGCTGVVSYKSAGASVTVVSDPVTFTVHVQDADSGDPVVGARVYSEVTSSAGGYPYMASVSITRSGSTATVSHPSHGLSTDDWVVIRGVDQPEYAGLHQVTVTGENEYTYQVSGTPASPATGAITCTFVPLTGTTDASGKVSATRAYAADQPVSGRVRDADGVPAYYRTGPFSGTIDSLTGLSVTVQLVKDQ